MSNLVLYVIVKSLPSMNPGKAEAHSGHAVSNFMVHNWKHGNLVDDWASEADGFGTQINLSDYLGGGNKLNLVKWVSNARANGLIAGLVTDSSYPYNVPNDEISYLINGQSGLPPQNADGSYTLTRKETTAAYVFGDKTSGALKSVISGIKLKE